MSGPVPPTLRFFGAAGTVTGSKHLLATPQARVLMDCGLFQGPKALRLRNRAPQPFDPERVSRASTAATPERMGSRTPGPVPSWRSKGSTRLGA